MDMSKYTQVFLDEARDYIQRINDSLLALEADPQGNRTVLNVIFRSVHTLKGMSATMGYSAMAEFTHQMENLLQKLRNGEVEPGEEVMDILFASLDVLEKMMDDIAAGGKGEVDTSDLRQRMLALLEKGADEVEPEPVKKKEEIVIEDEISFNEYESRLITEGKKRGFQAYHITVFIRENCLLKAARAYMVFRKLEKLGEIVKTVPSVQDIEDEKFNRSFEVILLSNRQPEE
ncbi:MAG: two-component system, chemotaxis family, sensor kinase CheA, partial [Eubacteriales bacterium]|nr:two-component system, chemotaxis family, sensor kinase CheA [Eubacteriales bacterium]